MPRLPSSATLRPALYALLLAMPFAAQAAAPASAADPVILKVDGIEVHKSEVVALQKSLGPQAASLPLDQFYQRVEDRLIVTKLLGAAAKSAKLDSDPEVKAEVAKAQDQVVARVFVNRLEAKAATDQAVKAAYDKNIKDQAGKPEIHARHILVASEDDAKAIIAALDKGGDFAKLADEKSTDKGGGTNGGDLGWFSKEQMVPEFSEAAFKLGKGEYTKAPVKSQFGWHVIKVEDTRISAPPSFDEAKEQIRTQLGNEAIETKVKELRAKAKIEKFALDGSALPATDAKPAPAAK
jgi:peptidyl-prolyl cis-trans isomerase C